VCTAVVEIAIGTDPQRPAPRLVCSGECARGTCELRSWVQYMGGINMNDGSVISGTVEWQWCACTSASTVPMSGPCGVQLVTSRTTISGIESVTRTFTCAGRCFKGDVQSLCRPTKIGQYTTPPIGDPARTCTIQRWQCRCVQGVTRLRKPIVRAQRIEPPKRRRRTPTPRARVRPRR
jgi:hypothetical protein